jgi:hypothetical protein
MADSLIENTVSTIAEFLLDDSSLTVFFAAAERINGVDVDPMILSTILPKMFPPPAAATPSAAATPIAALTPIADRLQL